MFSYPEDIFRSNKNYYEQPPEINLFDPISLLNSLFMPQSAPVFMPLSMPIISVSIIEMQYPSNQMYPNEISSFRNSLNQQISSSPFFSNY